MSNNHDVTYKIDARDRIIEVDDNWTIFARENDGTHLIPEQVLDRFLWDFISNLETYELYQTILQKVRAGQNITVHLRCDSPTLRRFLQLQMYLLPGGFVAFKSIVLRQERRSYVPLLDVIVPRSDEFIVMCSWCKKIKLPDERWTEVEAAVEQLNLFQHTSLPQISHGMCSDCYQMMAHYLIPQPST